MPVVSCNIIRAIRAIRAIRVQERKCVLVFKGRANTKV